MTTHAEDEAFDRPYDLRLMRRLLSYLRPYRVGVIVAVALLLAGAAMETVGPVLTQRALDVAVPRRDPGYLGVLVGLYLGSLVLAFVFEFAQTLLTTWLAQHVMYDLRVQVFARLQHLSLRYFDRNPVGRLMTRVTNDVEALNEAFSSGIVTAFGDVFTLVFILAAMLRLDLRLALVSFAVLPLVFAAAFVFRALIRRAFRDIRARLASINAFLQESLGGVRVLQLFGREREFRARHEAVNRAHLEANLRSITWYALFFPTIEVLTALAMALILWYGVWR